MLFQDAQQHSVLQQHTSSKVYLLARLVVHCCTNVHFASLLKLFQCRGCCMAAAEPPGYGASLLLHVLPYHAAVATFALCCC
jgi:hypothetical protein